MILQHNAIPDKDVRDLNGGDFDASDCEGVVLSFILGE